MPERENRDPNKREYTFYFGPWAETIELWHASGKLPAEQAWDAGCGFDTGFRVIDVNLGYCPSFPYTVVEEKEDTRIIRDRLGILQEVKKHGETIPRYLDYPVKTREDWLALKKERLNPDAPERFPENWKELVEEYRKSDAVLQLGTFPYGLFGTLRDMMGVESLLINFYDEPELIAEMMDGLTDFWLAIYEKVCAQVKVDAIHMWEDMSGKCGSLISPAMVREFMMPNYQKISRFANKHDIPIFSVDTDGDCSQLLPLFVESGINLVFPFEVAAGSDVVAYRKQYPNLAVMGGIDKMEVARGKDGIERELSRISPLLKTTGYVPALDHLIPPEVSYEDFRCFCARLWEELEKHP